MGAGESEFFYYESKFKIQNFFFCLYGGGRGARVSVFFFYKESKSNLKKKYVFFFFLGGGGGVRWTDRRTGPNRFVPSTSLKLGGRSWGHNNALMCKLCP